MDGNDQRQMFEVSRARFSFASSGRYWRNSVIFALSGIITGIAIANVIYARSVYARARSLTGIAILLMLAIQFVLMMIEARELRKWRKELLAEHEKLRAFTKAELERLFPEDPEFVEHVMTDIGELKP